MTLLQKPIKHEGHYTCAALRLLQCRWGTPSKSLSSI